MTEIMKGIISEVVKALGNDTSDKNVKKALGIICQFSGYSQGCIYNATNHPEYVLDLAYTENGKKPTVSKYSLDGIVTKSNDLSGGINLFCKKCATKGSVLEKLSKIFGECFLIFPIKDDEQTIKHIVFYGNENIPDDTTKEILEILLNILAVSISKEYYKRLAEHNAMLVKIMDNLGTDVYISDIENQEILYANQSMEAPYGVSLKGKECWKVLYDDKDGPCDYCPKNKLADPASNGKYSWNYRRPFDGKWFRVVTKSIDWKGRRAILINSIDLSEIREDLNNINILAYRDSLTGLYNRNKLERDFNEYIKKDNVMICFIDLNGFKRINDELGHDAGDKFLAMVANKINSDSYLKNCVYRYGGDEFIIMIPDSEDKLKVVDERLTKIFSIKWKLEDREFLLGASMGVAVYPRDSKDIRELITKADKAMYFAKQKPGLFNIVKTSD